MFYVGHNVRQMLYVQTTPLGYMQDQYGINAGEATDSTEGEREREFGQRYLESRERDR